MARPQYSNPPHCVYYLTFGILLSVCPDNDDVFRLGRGLPYNPCIYHKRQY